MIRLSYRVSESSGEVTSVSSVSFSVSKAISSEAITSEAISSEANSSEAITSPAIPLAISPLAISNRQETRQNFNPPLLKYLYLEIDNLIMVTVWSDSEYVILAEGTAGCHIEDGAVAIQILLLRVMPMPV